MRELISASQEMQEGLTFLEVKRSDFLPEPLDDFGCAGIALVCDILLELFH